MSTRAKVGGWVAAFLVLGGWSWHLARYDGFQLLVILGCLAGALWLALRSLRSIDSQRDCEGCCDDLCRAADPRRFNGERP